MESIYTGDTVQLISRPDYSEGSVGVVVELFDVSARSCYVVQFPDESRTYAFAEELRIIASAL